MFSCNTEKTNCREMPYIIVDKYKDSLFIGDTLKGIIRISDTTFLRMITQDGYSSINPIVFLDGEKAVVNNQETIVNYYIDSTFVEKYCDSTGYFSLGIEMMIPHPQRKGDVTLSSGIDGTIISR